MEIKVDDPRHPQITALLQEHLQSMESVSPPESMHALDTDALCLDEITFCGAWQGELLAGCGALKELDAYHAEIKSMRTANDFLHQGVATRLLEYLLQIAQARGYRRLSLETGSMAYFDPARKFYARHGFIDCPPFAEYVEDPNSVFMTRQLG